MAGEDINGCGLALEVSDCLHQLRFNYASDEKMLVYRCRSHLM